MAKIVAGATRMRLLRIYNLSSEASVALFPQTEYFQLAPRTEIPRATIVIQNKPVWLFPGALIARIIPKMRKKVAKTMPVRRPSLSIIYPKKSIPKISPIRYEFER
jgi:hypothetical protein